MHSKTQRLCHRTACRMLSRAGIRHEPVSKRSFMPASSYPIRVGVLIPENNTRVEEELPLWLPGSRLEVVRIPRGKGLLTAAALPEYKERALVLSKKLARDDNNVRSEERSVGKECVSTCNSSKT